MLICIPNLRSYMDLEVLGPEESKFCRSCSSVLLQTFYDEAPKALSA
jgi:hypothetical protein